MKFKNLPLTRRSYSWLPTVQPSALIQRNLPPEKAQAAIIPIKKHFKVPHIWFSTKNRRLVALIQGRNSMPTAGDVPMLSRQENSS